MCASGKGFASGFAEASDDVGAVAGGGALVAGIAAIATSETGAGLVSFGSAAIVLEGISRFSSTLAIGAKFFDHNYGGMIMSGISMGLGVGLGGQMEKAGMKAVAAGQIGARQAKALNVGVGADSILNDTLLHCSGG